jgi:hypothetical protein
LYEVRIIFANGIDFAFTSPEEFHPDFVGATNIPLAFPYVALYGNDVSKDCTMYLNPSEVAGIINTPLR